MKPLKKPKYTIGIQNVEVRPGATGAEKTTAMAEFAGHGSNIGSTIGSAFGPWGTAIGGAVGAIGGAVGGFFKGQRDEQIADSARRTDELDRKETMEQNMSYGGQENKQLKNATIMQNNAGLIAANGMKKTPHALVEVEGQELVYRKNNKGKYQLVQDHGGGPTHEQGGIDTWVKEGDVITPAKDRGVFMNITNPATGEVIDDNQFEYFKNKLPEDNQEKPVKAMMECGTRSVKPRYFLGGIMGMMGGGGGGGMMGMLGGGGGGGGGGNMMNPIGNLISGGLNAAADSAQKSADQQIQQNAMQNQAINQAQMSVQNPQMQQQLPMQRNGNKYVKPKYGIGALVEGDSTGQTIIQPAGSTGSSTETKTSTTSTTPGETTRQQQPDVTMPGSPGYFDPNAKPLPESPENYPTRLGPKGVEYAKKNPEWWAKTLDQIKLKPKDPITIPGEITESTTPPKVEVKEEIKKESTPGGAPNANQNDQIGPPIDVRSGDVTGGDNNITFEKGMFGPSDAAVAEQEKTKRAAENNRAREAQPDIPPPQQFEYGKYQAPAGELVAPNLNFDPASPTYQQYQDLSDPLRNQSNLAMNRDMANARELSGGSAANARANMAQASAGNFARQQQIDTQEMGRLSQVDAANRQTDNQFNMYNNQGANAAAQANAQNLAQVQNQNMLNANQALNTNLNAMQTDRASARARDDYNKYTKEVQIERDRMAMERERQNKLIYGIPDNNPFTGHRTLGTKGPQDTDKGPVSKWFPNRGGSTTPDPTPEAVPQGPELGVLPGALPNDLNPVPRGGDPNALPNPNSQPVPDAPLPNTPDMKPQAGGYVSPGKELPTGPSTMPLFKKGSKYVKPRYAEGGEVDEDETEETDAGTADTGDAGFAQHAKENPNSEAVRLAANSLDKKRALYDYKAKRDLAIEENKTARHAAYYDMVRSRQQRINQTDGATGIGTATESQTAPVTDTATGTTTSTTSRTGTSGNPGANQNQQFAAPIDVKSGDVIGGDNNIVFPSGGGYGYNNQGQPQAPISPPPNVGSTPTATPGGYTGPMFGRPYREAKRLAKAEMNQTQYLTEQKQKQERVAAKTATKNARTQGKYAYKSYKDDAEAQRRLNQTQNNYGQYVEEREQAQEDAADMDTYNQMMKQKGIVNRGENREQRGYNRAQGQDRRQGNDIDRILHKTEMDNVRAQRKLQGIKNDDAAARAYDNTVFVTPDLPEADGLPTERRGNAWVRPNYKEKKKSKS